MTTTNNRYWLGLIILVALALRLYPHAEFGPDGIRFVGTCGQMIDEVKPLVASGNLLNFENFYYPTVGPLIVASTALVIKSSFPQSFDVSLYCLFVTIAFSVGTLVILYSIAMRWGEYVGLAAMAFFAVTMIAVDCSDTVQVYETFFAMLAINFFLRSLDSPTFVNLCSMGTFLGLSVSSKYFSATLFPMFLVAQLLLSRSKVSFQGDHDIQHHGSHQRFSTSSWNIVTLVAFCTLALALYVAIIYKGLVFSFLKEIYDTQSHENPFEYHINAINRYYKFIVFALASSTVAIAAVIGIPLAKGMDQWEWFKPFCWSNRFWLIPSLAMAGTFTLVLGVPVALNLNNFVRYSSFVSKAFATGDGGIFPSGHPAPSYFFSYFPESLGIPLFLLSCAGIVVSLYKRERTAIILIIILVPMFVALERSSVRVNRYALDFMPILCLFAALAIKYLWTLNSTRVFKLTVLILFNAIFTYSLIYSIAWAEFKRTIHLIPVQANAWIDSHIPGGSSIGMKSSIWIPGSPQLMPDPSKLQRYKIVNYTDKPEYVIVPQLLYDVGTQYWQLSESGYTYTPDDWFPQSPPLPQDIAALLDVIRERGYTLVQNIAIFPSFAGVAFTSEVFGDKTWQLEHAGPYGIRVYKKKER